MLLRVEQCHHVGATVCLHVEPRRELGQWTFQIRRAEYEQRDAHLHPCRAALRRCRDDDVVGAVGEPVPSGAVADERPVPPHLHGADVMASVERPHSHDGH